MADADFQSIRIGAVVNGQGYGNSGNLYITHDAASGEIKLTFVIFGCPQESFVAECVCHLHSGDDGFVIGNGKFSCFCDLGCFCLSHLLLICGVYFGLVFLIVVVGNKGIQGQSQCQQEHDCGKGYGDDFLFHSSSRYENCPGGLHPPGRESITDGTSSCGRQRG